MLAGWKWVILIFSKLIDYILESELKILNLALKNYEQEAKWITVIKVANNEEYTNFCCLDNFK